MDLSSYYTKSEVDSKIENIQLKEGPQGETGPQGPTGEPGATGPQGQPGINGNDGYTPVKGKDYFTEADKAEMAERVKNAFIYSYLPDTGFATGPDTTANVVARMPGDSTIIFTLNDDKNSILTDLPILYGVCVLVKGVNNSFPFGIATNITGGVSYILNRKSGEISWTRILTNVLSAEDYGDTLPAAGTPGRIFFKKVST